MYTDNGFKITAFKVSTKEELGTIYSGYIENPYDPDNDITCTSSLWIAWDINGQVFNMPDSFNIKNFISQIVKNNLPVAV